MINLVSTSVAINRHITTENGHCCPVLNAPIIGNDKVRGNAANTQCYQIVQVSGDTGQIFCNTSTYHDEARCGKVMHFLYCLIPIIVRGVLTFLLCECHTAYKCNPFFMNHCT